MAVVTRPAAIKSLHPQTQVFRSITFVCFFNDFYSREVNVQHCDVLGLFVLQEFGGAEPQAELESFFLFFLLVFIFCFMTSFRSKVVGHNKPPLTF